MRKLNNKGITTIEVILCFILVAIITVSMYSTISSFNEKRIIERDKEEIYSYKNILTKDIQDDFIKIGLTHASYQKTVSGNKTIHTVSCDLKDGSSRTLIIEQQFAKSKYHIGGTANTDYFMIKYGQGKDGTNLIEYPLPDLGDALKEKQADGTYKIVKNLSINNVYVNISDENVLSIYIGFYHPELTTRYGISIVSPIDYVSYESSDSKWTY